MCASVITFVTECDGDGTCNSSHDTTHDDAWRCGATHDHLNFGAEVACKAVAADPINHARIYWHAGMLYRHLYRKGTDTHGHLSTLISDSRHNKSQQSHHEDTEHCHDAIKVSSSCSFVEQL